MKRLLLAVLVAGCASSLPFAPPPRHQLHAGLQAASASASAANEDAFLAGRPPIAASEPKAPPRILEATTKNGVRVLGIERHDLPIASFGIVLKNAMADDAPAGFRSLLFGTLRRGTKTAERGDIYARFTQLAISWDTSSVAARGEYFEIKAVRSLAPIALGMTLDMFGEPGLRKEDFDDALDGVTSLATKRDRPPATIAFDAALDRLYPKSAAFRTVDAEALRKLHLSDVTTFAQRALTAENVVVAAAGDFDWKNVLEHVEDGLGKLPRGAVPWPATDRAPPEGALLIPYTSKQTALVLAFRGPGTNHPDRAAMTLADRALTTLLFRDLRLTHGITYGSSVGVYPGRDAPPILIRMEIEPGGLFKALDGVFGAIGKLETLGDDEVTRSRTLAQAQLLDDVGTTSEAIDTLAWFAANDLPTTWYGERSTALGTVTAADIARVARTYFRREIMQLVIVGDVSGLDAQLAARNLGPVTTREP